MKAFLFDLDGTLLDTLRDIADAANAALEQHGFPVHPVAAYRHFVGDGVQVLISRLVPVERHDPATLKAVSQAHAEAYRRLWKATTQPYPGIPELLDALTRRGIPMAVLSNKPDEFTRACVSELLPSWKFSVVLGALPSLPRKPDPTGALQVARSLGVAPAQVLYVGDTATDMQTAVAAGMHPAGVLWGFRDAAELRSAGARRIVAHPRELLAALD